MAGVARRAGANSAVIDTDLSNVRKVEVARLTGGVYREAVEVGGRRNGNLGDQALN